MSAIKVRTIAAAAVIWIGLFVFGQGVLVDTCAESPGPGCDGGAQASATVTAAQPSLSPIPGQSLLPAPTGTLAPSPTAELLFGDEFDGTQLDSVWGRHWPGFGSTIWVRSHSRVADGVLRITATRDGDHWVSDLIDTVGTFEQRYGTFSARIRFPEGKGLWPAFWLAQPQNPEREMAEVDIMEVCATSPEEHETANATLLRMYVHRSDGSHGFTAWVPGANLSGDWHTYSVDWRAHQMVFSLDGVEVARLIDANEIPTMKMAVVLDLAVGGNFCGVGPTTPDSATMEVDWVRVAK